MKCAHIDCAREGTKRFGGRHTPGRLPTEAGGVPYCSAHYEQLRRGEELHSTKRPGAYRIAMRHAATIAESHNQPGLAEIFRGLGK